MDVVVSRAEGSDEWTFTDLLGRPMGVIKESSEQRFVIEPAGGAVETMGGMAPSTAALTPHSRESRRHTLGVCRRDWENYGEGS